jgi:hypothetical protein
MGGGSMGYAASVAARASSMERSVSV